MRIAQVFFLALLAATTLPSVAASLSDVVMVNRNSVVYIKVEKAAEITGAVTEQHGTGFVVNQDGFVLTAAHIVSSGPGFQVEVRGAEGSREGPLEGMEVLYENSNFDVAVLRFKNTAKQRKAVSLGDPWKVAEDATVYAMGFPGVEEWFHTEGKLSGKGPKGSWNTTITLNPGMSGGPILNTEGKVVAMVWGAVSTQGIAGINRVLPINLLADALRITGGIAPGGSPPPPIPIQGIEKSYRFDETQNSLGGLQAGSRSYSRTFQSEPGFKIVDYKYVAKSANNANISRIVLSPDGKVLTVDFSLTSGPVFDQWRGWIDAEVLTRQVKE